ncbi:MAG TPA: PDZ domain-containing protein [Candidatus Polarisedimenticolia bacterium]|nr:PDZ domain-containing protein [Candidatus Polarisedimenticolia bacterium]
MRRSIPGAVLAALLAGTAAPAADEGEGAAFRKLFETHKDSVVAVTYVLRPREKPTGGEGRKVEDALCGVVASAGGLIVTSADPFPDPGGDPKTTLIPVEFKVHLRGRRPLEAEAVGLDRELNLAYLKLKQPPVDLKPAAFDEAARLEVGDRVAVIGLLSRHDEYAPIVYPAMVNAVLDKPRRLYNLDLNVQDLSIGGLVVSGRGRAVGIVGEDLLREAPMGERVPANALAILGSITQGRRVGYPRVFPYGLFAAGLAAPPPIAEQDRRSWLGIIMQPLDENLIDYWGLDVDGGIIISSVVENSPAERAGLAAGDVLVELQGEPVKVKEEEDLGDFRRRIERMGVGREIALTFLRRGEKRAAALTLAEAPLTAWSVEELEDEELGLTVREISLDDLLAQNLDPATRGVVVSEMEQAGWAQIGGLQLGDVVQAVDGRRVTDLASFRTQSERLKEERPEGTLFFVLRQSETLFVRLKTPWGGRRG